MMLTTDSSAELGNMWLKFHIVCLTFHSEKWNNQKQQNKKDKKYISSTC